MVGNRMDTVNVLDLIKELNTDASVWAEAFTDAMFINEWGVEDIDRDLMTSWFATAIETAKDSMRYANSEDSFHE